MMPMAGGPSNFSPGGIQPRDRISFWLGSISCGSKPARSLLSRSPSRISAGFSSFDLWYELFDTADHFGQLRRKPFNSATGRDSRDSLLTAINTRGLRLGRLIQNSFTFTKTAALLALVLLGLFVGWNLNSGRLHVSIGGIRRRMGGTWKQFSRQPRSGGCLRSGWFWGGQ